MIPAATTEGWVRYKSVLFVFITFDKQEANQQRPVGTLDICCTADHGGRCEKTLRLIRGLHHEEPAPFDINERIAT
jgi:hypothetical protein